MSPEEQRYSHSIQRAGEGEGSSGWRAEGEQPRLAPSPPLARPPPRPLGSSNGCQSAEASIAQEVGSARPPLGANALLPGKPRFP